MPPTLIFDGECVICSAGVRFVLRHERDAELHFTTTQSAHGRALAAVYGITPADLDQTFVLVEDGTARLRSDAAVGVASHLKLPWRWLGLVRIVPRPIRDRAYSLLARNRIRWFGRRDTCFLPEPTQRHRFLE